jgi:hypothetical protein
MTVGCTVGLVVGVAVVPDPSPHAPNAAAANTNNPVPASKRRTTTRLSAAASPVSNRSALANADETR